MRKRVVNQKYYEMFEMQRSFVIEVSDDVTDEQVKKQFDEMEDALSEVTWDLGTPTCEYDIADIETEVLECPSVDEPAIPFDLLVKKRE